ncbi:epsin-2 isoform X2 [Lingula anatina]|uniref:Epsin-2 isoform X2 n=1 Tax=Lingula anatina TaxID=7574 RepID=A0A1S3JDK9_LINAN|nr:epsin-2 isoform X2 [Lingula anatina]|eukprot:XP_013408495.1 epsin-2 isoform X2 [Lingula anatina]
MPPIRRTIKNVVKNFSDPQIKVREATSNDPWGPSSTLMGEIADLTYNVVAFTEIMQMVWKRLNDHGKNWRHVYKSLVLLEYIIKTGSEKVAQQCKENIFAIQTLKDFQYVEDNKDQGMNVREKAKQLVALLKDDERLKNERAKALKAKERFAQNPSGIGSQGGQQVQFGKGPGTSPKLETTAGGYSDPYGGATGAASSPSNESRLSTEIEAARPSTVGEEELQLQLALAMSKEEHDEEVRKMRGDDVRLQLAMEESQKEEPVQEGGLLDIMGHTTPQPQKQSVDPWGTPIPQLPKPAERGGSPWGEPPPSQPQPVADPWGSPAPPPAAAASDPWGTSGSSKSTPAHTPAHDPWGAPISTAAAPVPASKDIWGAPASPSSGAGVDPFGSSATPSHTLDDEFDILSSRTTAAPSSDTTTTSTSQASGSLLGDSDDLFNLGSLNSALPPQQDKKKKPEDFLGANSSLVNLDALIAKPEGNPYGTTNPFATNGIGGTPDPFGVHAPPVRVPMGQMQTSNSMGFTQATNSTLLPQPLMPMGGPPPQQPVGMGMQSQGYNPFL